jgi:hypothetical protein
MQNTQKKALHALEALSKQKSNFLEAKSNSSNPCLRRPQSRTSPHAASTLMGLFFDLPSSHAKTPKKQWSALEAHHRSKKTTLEAKSKPTFSLQSCKVVNARANARFPKICT